MRGKTVRWRAVTAASACAILIAGACASQSSAAPKTSGLSGTITVWDLNYNSIPGYTKEAKALDAAFEKAYPHVKVKHVAEPSATYTQTLTAAFASHQGADVMMIVGGSQGVLRWAPGLQKLNSIVSPAQKKDLNGWADTSADYNPNGSIYGIPVGEQGTVFYYNKALFRKAGLSANFDPKTWAQVAQAAAKLKAAGITPFTGGDEEGYENEFWMTTTWPTVNTEAQAQKLADGKISLTSSEVSKAFGPEFEFQNDGYFGADRFSTPLFPNGAAAFGQKDGAMFLGLWSSAAYYGDYDPLLGANNVGVFFAPGSKYVSDEPVYAWSVPKWAANKPAAEAYVKFVTSDAAMRALYHVGGVLPNDSKVHFLVGAPPAEKAIIKWSHSLPAYPDVHQTLPGAVVSVLNTAINSALQGQTTLHAAEVSMQQAWPSGG
jgi:ABC-type glycerol-3-phosphate transport system substrate-binding protein